MLTLALAHSVQRPFCSHVWPRPVSDRAEIPDNALLRRDRRAVSFLFSTLHTPPGHRCRLLTIPSPCPGLQTSSSGVYRCRLTVPARISASGVISAAVDRTPSPSTSQQIPCSSSAGRYSTCRVVQEMSGCHAVWRNSGHKVVAKKCPPLPPPGKILSSCRRL